MEPGDKEILEGLKEGNEKVLTSLYRDYRGEFLHWSYKNLSLSEDEAADVFQDAVVTFYYNAKSGKVTELQSSAKTYLFAIGKNLALKKLKRDSRMVTTDHTIQGGQEQKYDRDIFEASERQKVVADMIKSMGEPCKSILRMFYFDRYTMDSIASRLDYKNEHVVKSQKLRCFNQLKKMITERFDVEDL